MTGFLGPYSAVGTTAKMGLILETSVSGGKPMIPITEWAWLVVMTFVPGPLEVPWLPTAIAGGRSGLSFALRILTTRLKRKPSKGRYEDCHFFLDSSLPFLGLCPLLFWPSLVDKTLFISKNSRALHSSLSLTDR